VLRKSFKKLPLNPLQGNYIIAKWCKLFDIEC